MKSTRDLPPVIASETPLPPEERARRALDLIVAAIDRPFGDLFALVELVKTLYTPDDGQAVIESLARSPAAVRLLVERSRILVSEADLARCEPGSLGAALHRRHGGLPLAPFDFGGSDVHAFVVQHLVDTAPFWQEVLGIEPGDDARFLQLGFYAAQVAPAATFFSLIAKNLLKVALERPDRHDDHLAALVRGWVLGRRTRPLFGADWLALIPRPLAEVRAGFELAERDAQENARITGASFASEVNQVPTGNRTDFLAAFRRIVLLPYGDAGFANGQVLREAGVTPDLAMRLAQRLLSDPEVMARFGARPRLGILDFAALHRLPEGTLGRVYADHMLVKGFGPPPSIPEGETDLGRYFVGHLIETHDVWHAVTGAGTDKRGECCLHAFYNGQIHPSPVQLAYLARCILKTALFDLDRADVHMDAIARGWLLGRRAKPLALVDWTVLFATPLADIRGRFSIPPDGVDGMPLEPPVGHTEQ